MLPSLPLPVVQVIKKSCYPRWNETFEFDLDESAVEKLCVIEVWDWDLVSRNDFLGKVSSRERGLGRRQTFKCSPSKGIVLFKGRSLRFSAFAFCVRFLKESPLSAGWGNKHFKIKYDCSKHRDMEKAGVTGRWERRSYIWCASCTLPCAIGGWVINASRI